MTRAEQVLYTLNHTRAIWGDVQGGKLDLITPEEFEALPDGVKLVCIDGTKAVKGVDSIDDDTRFGRLAYGFVFNE